MASKAAAIATVLHDVSYAARYSDTIVVLKDGLVHSYGSPGDIVNERMLLEVFEAEA